jgi:hypothetical protein
VTIHVKAPEGAARVTVANDGRFASSSDFTSAARIPWTLVSAGADQLPKVVYGCFNGARPVYSDDIILDQTDPTISEASVGPRRPAALDTARMAATRTLRVTATDNRSGVRRLQYNTERSTRGATTVLYRARLTIPARATTWVRVRDGALNWSRWREAR